MDLYVRPARLNETPKYIPYLRENFALTDQDRSDLGALCREIVADELGFVEVMEDQVAPLEERVVYFGIGLFLSEEFCRCAKTLLPPIITRHLLDWRRRGLAPTLSPAQMRHANSERGEGLRMLTLSGGPDWILSRDRGFTAAGTEVMHRIPEWILTSCRGYRLSEFLIETYGEMQAGWSVGAGLHLRTDYAAYNRAPSPCLPHHRAFLHSVNRPEARHAAYGSLIAPLFNWSPPRFGFRPPDQALLRRALLGDTDDQIADALCLSLSSVHKRWRGIFDRVSVADPDLLPLGAEELSGGRGRGAEKRSILLRYLQRHPEELRPSEPSDPLLSNSFKTSGERSRATAAPLLAARAAGSVS
jgi:hypothetical protein